jgi:hypothetical protein
MSSGAVHDVAVLRRGPHVHPRRGGCLAELASTLPGGPWTDHPATVDPVLACLARGVNDRSGEAGRQRLVWLAPWLVAGPPHRLASGVMVAGLAGRFALGRADPAAAGRLAPAVARLEQPPSSSRWPRLWDARRRRDALRVTRSAVRILGQMRDRDDILGELLLMAVNLCRAAEGLVALSPAVLDAADCPSALAVRAELRTSDGSAESGYFHCAAILDQWPTPLRTAWQRRNAELYGLRGEVPALSGNGPPHGVRGSDDV